MKTKITIHLNNVTVERDDPFTGERSSTTYLAPYLASGKPGYVRIRDSAGHYSQVCEQLYGTGNALVATPETLPAVIRRELRRRAAAERRELNQRRVSLPRRRLRYGAGFIRARTALAQIEEE